MRCCGTPPSTSACRVASARPVESDQLFAFTPLRYGGLRSGRRAIRGVIPSSIRRLAVFWATCLQVSQEAGGVLA
jgi:hypothetical protein